MPSLVALVSRTVPRTVFAAGLLVAAVVACGSSSRTSGETSAVPDAADDSGGTAVAVNDAAPSSGLDGGASDGGDATVDSAPSVGATTPFTSYEAEVGALSGAAAVHALAAAPTSEYSSPELEASGHAYVALTATGDAVAWVNKTGSAVTAINVRYSIPDSPDGGGITATLDLYVNGQMRQALPLNSMQTWIYENANNYNGNDQNPADGNPRVFFDDVHAFISGAPVAPGDTITLQKDAANGAAFYDIDVIDVEAPAAATSAPRRFTLDRRLRSRRRQHDHRQHHRDPELHQRRADPEQDRLDPPRDLLSPHDHRAHGDRDHDPGGRRLVQPDLPERAAS